MSLSRPARALDLRPSVRAPRSYGVVSRADGEIAVESEPGRGSSFRAALPLARRDAGKPTPGREKPVPTRGSGTILVAEDQEQVRTAARRVLESRGYDVVEAIDGVEALEILERGTPRVDLVLSDLVMPRMRGQGLAQRVWELRPVLPIILMNGYAAEGLEGADGNPFRALRKPWRMDDLIRAVDDLLESSPRGAS